MDNMNDRQSICIPVMCRDLTEGYEEEPNYLTMRGQIEWTSQYTLQILSKRGVTEMSELRVMPFTTSIQSTEIYTVDYLRSVRDCITVLRTLAKSSTSSLWHRMLHVLLESDEAPSTAKDRQFGTRWWCNTVRLSSLDLLLVHAFKMHWKTDVASLNFSFWGRSTKRAGNKNHWQKFY